LLDHIEEAIGIFETDEQTCRATRNMDDFLIPIRTSKTSAAPLIQDVTPQSKIEEIKTIKSASDALQVLNNEPDLETFKAVVQYFDKTRSQSTALHIPSRTTTPILNALLQDVLPNYWSQLQDEESLKGLLATLIRCLRGLPALGAVTGRLKLLIDECKKGLKQPGRSSFLSNQLRCNLGLLSGMLQGDGFVLGVWRNLAASDLSITTKDAIWKSFGSTLTSSRLIATVWEAEDYARKMFDYDEKLWLGNGLEYMQWLTRNIVTMALDKAIQTGRVHSWVDLFAQSFGLTYQGFSSHDNV
jgi:hypothetical protein